MAERPIIFSGPMIRALLAGKKTMTRRIIKGDPARVYWHPVVVAGYGGWVDEHGRPVGCPYGAPGDRLWVRETIDYDAGRGHFYKATGMYVGPLLDYEREPPPANGLPCRAIPSIHMPRWASRITLEITGVRVERPQDISDSDAEAEGCNPRQPLMASGIVIPGQWRLGYRDLWEQIHGTGSWNTNPWVWVLNFKRVEQGVRP